MRGPRSTVHKPRSGHRTQQAPRTTQRHAPDIGRTAQRPRVRALCAAFPSRSPLLPALTRSLRAASAFPTSPPHRARGRGREHYGSATRVNRQEGGPIRKRTGGKPGTPPDPEKHGPVPGFPPDPHSCLPRQKQRTAPMTEENARHTPQIPRRTCRTRKLQGARGTRETPQSPVSPVPPDPLPPFPRPKGALRAPQPTPIPRRPSHHGIRHANAPTPGTRPRQPGGKRPRTR